MPLIISKGFLLLCLFTIEETKPVSYTHLCRLGDFRHAASNGHILSVIYAFGGSGLPSEGGI